MEKLFFVWLNVDAFGNSDKFICTEKQIAYFENQLAHNTGKVFLCHSNGRYMLCSKDVHTMRIEEANPDFSEKNLFEAIEKDPQRVLTLALEQLVSGILAETVGQQKAYLQKITEGLKGELRVTFLEDKIAAQEQKRVRVSVTLDTKGCSMKTQDPKIPNLDELRDRIAEESESPKKGSMEKYNPKDDRFSHKPHCCVQAHGLMREATPEERLAAIKKAS